MSIPERQVLLEHVGFLRAVALGVLRNEADADDVVQQTLATALQKPPADDSNLRGWLATVARNFARMQLRSRSRRKAREELVARPEGTPSAARIAQRMEMERHVVDAIATLDEPFRTTLILRYYDDLQPKEIAQRQGVPAATVRTRLKRGLDKLRAQLERKSGGNRKAMYAGLLLLAQIPARAAPALRWIPAAGVAAVLVGVVGVAWLASETAQRSDDPTTARTTSVRNDASTVEETDSPPALDADVCTVSGRVLDPRGMSLANVEVIAFEHAGANLIDTPESRWNRWLHPPKQIARTTSDDIGNYSLNVRPVRPFWLVLRAEKHAIRLLPMPDATGTYTAVDIVMHPSIGVLGRLRDEEGAPIVGAKIQAWNSEFTLFGAPALVSTETDEKGRYTLPYASTYLDGALSKLNRISLVIDARKAGYAPRVIRNEPPIYSSLVLERHPPLEIRTEPGFRVMALAAEAIDFRAASAEGVATFPEFPGGDRTLIFLGRGGRARQVLLPAGSLPLGFEATPDGLAGRVADATTGEPVAGAKIGWAPNANDGEALFEALAVTTTDEYGLFSFAAGSDSAASFVVAHPDRSAVHVLELADCPKADGAFEVALDDDGELRGEVVDSTGAPVAGARIRIRRFGLYASWQRSRRRLWTAVTRQDGTFVIRGVPRTRAMRTHSQVEAWHPLHGAARRNGIPASAPVRFTLRNTGSVEPPPAPERAEPSARAEPPAVIPDAEPLDGRVVHRGEPIANAWVRVVFRGRVRDHAKTGPDGRFSVRRWSTRGPYELVIEAPGFLTARNRKPAAGDIEMERAAAYVVQVVDPRGEPRMNVELRTGERALVTDREGMVRLFKARDAKPEFVVLPGGPGWIRFGEPQWSKDEGMLKLVVRRGERIEGQVLDSENRGVPHILVLARPTAKGRATRRAFTNSKGYFVLRALHPERYSLRVGEAKQGVEIEAGTTELVLRKESR